MLRFFNLNKGATMPQGDTSGRIEGPPATRFATDAGEPAIGAQLPRSVRDRLRALQRRHDDARDLLRTLTDRIIAGQQDRAHAAAIVRERQQHVGRPITAAAREHAEAELQRAERKLQDVDEELAELQERAEQTKALRDPLSHVLRAIDEGLRKAAKVSAVDPVQPRLRKGESHADCVERLRADLEKLAAKRASVEAAPLPLQEALPLALAQLDQLAERGRPNVWPLLEAGLPLRWPTAPLRVDVTGALALPSGDHGHQLAGTAHGETIDVAGMLCWLFRDQMAKRIEAELRECCADSEPLTREERAKRLAEIDAERLALEREEVASIEASDWKIALRSETDWRALLSIEVVQS